MNELSQRTDPRAQRSRASIIAALVELVETQPVAEISITRVVEAAGITRPTFYQHFPDITTAVQSAGFERLAAAFPVPEPGPARMTDAELRERIVAHAAPVLRHLAEHLGFYRQVLASAIGVGFFDNLVSFVASRILPELASEAGQPEPLQQNVRTVIAAGMTWLVLRWVAGGALRPDRAEVLAGEAADVALSLRRPGQASTSG